MTSRRWNQLMDADIRTKHQSWCRLRDVQTSLSVIVVWLSSIS